MNVGAEQLDAVIALLPSHEVARRSTRSPATAGSRSRPWSPSARSTRSSRRSRTPAPPASSSCRSPRSSREHRRLGTVGHGGRRSTARSASARSTAADGTRYPFHCIEIADGSRDIAVGAAVHVRPARQARPLRGRRHQPGLTGMASRPRPADPRRHPVARARARWSPTATSPTDAGYPRLSRLVGPSAGHHRRRPALVAGGEQRRTAGAGQRSASRRELLRAEGVTVDDGRVRRAPVGRFSRAGRALDLHEREADVAERRRPS